MVLRVYTRSMETIYPFQVHTGSWGNLFHEIPCIIFALHEIFFSNILVIFFFNKFNILFMCEGLLLLGLNLFFLTLREESESECLTVYPSLRTIWSSPISSLRCRQGILILQQTKDISYTRVIGHMIYLVTNYF